MLTIHPPSFIETEDCDGPRYVRGQPSRETGSILMSDIQNKYITEFELPSRNIERYIKEIGNNWNRLDDKERQLAKKSFQDMGMLGKLETFGNVEDSTPTPTPTSTSTGPNPVDPVVANFIKYLSMDTVNNPPMFMDTLWNTDANQMAQIGVTKDQLTKIKDSMYQWSVDNSYVLHSNWRSGSILGFFLLLIIILIIIAAAGSESGNGNGSAAFGRSLFGRR